MTATPSKASPTFWLDNCLAPLAPFLGRDDVTDVWINRPGQVWIEALDGTTRCFDMPELTSGHLARLVQQAAAAAAQGINRTHPILSASLPTGERIQAVIPPATREHVAIAIRKHSRADIGLEGFDAATEPPGDYALSKDAAAIRAAGGVPTGDWRATLRAAVRDRRNILISGGTSSGKTTFLNALLAAVSDNERLIVIEDAPELKVTQPNFVGLIASRGDLGEALVSADDLLIASLRMRPDRIILGEIRGGEASTFLRAINTGHPGSLSTIHANSPERAIDQLAFLVLQSGIRMSFDDVVTYVKRSIDVVVQVDRHAGKRRVREVFVP